ncbi:MAG: phosphate acetyltransferase, partial [Ignavibacteriales bacterium]|nr:phosphate acetyltransferase [Ignavibacteriales bacterium]
DVYIEQLLTRMGVSKEILRRIIEKAKKQPRKIVFPEGEQLKILQAAQILVDEGIAYPVLIGNPQKIKELTDEHNIQTDGFEIVDPENFPRLELYAEELYKLRQRRGLLRHEVYSLLKNKNYFGSMMVHLGEADGLISGMTSTYPNTIKPALHCVKLQEGVKKVSGCYIVLVKKNVFFFADTTVNVDPNAEELAEIAMQTAMTAKRFGVEPRVAMLAFSNFGSAPYPQTEKVAKAVQIVKQRMPELEIDGEMQADTAVVPEILAQQYPFVSFRGPANVLIFPDLNSGNIAYKLMARIGSADVIGPILMGMSKPVHVLQKGAEINDVVNMTAVAVVEANSKKI